MSERRKKKQQSKQGYEIVISQCKEETVECQMFQVAVFYYERKKGGKGKIKERVFWQWAQTSSMVKNLTLQLPAFWFSTTIVSKPISALGVNLLKQKR